MTVSHDIFKPAAAPPPNRPWFARLIAWLYSSPNPQVKAYFASDELASGGSPSGSEVDIKSIREPILHTKK